MLGHTLGYLYSGAYSFFLSFLSGFFGVELFFVLSGILIGKLLIQVFEKENYTKHLKNFILRRWFRTLPMYFIALFVYAFGDYFFDAIKNPEVPVWKYFFFLQNFFEVKPMFFGVSWSLSVEEWFYVLFPFVLFLIKKGKPKISTKSLFVIAISVFLFYFLFMRFLAFSGSHFSFYEGVRKVAFFRLDSIVFGILMAFVLWFYPKFISEKKKILFLNGCLILLLNQYLIFKDNFTHLQYFNTLYYSVLGFGLMLIFPLFKDLKLKKSFFTKTITKISKISYSLYLVHWLVFKFLEMSYFSEIPTLVKFILFFLISFLVATFTYQFIEKPFLKFRDKRILH